MKKADTEIVRCCTCSPFKKFLPPNAAEQARQHDEIGKHDTTSHGSEVTVQL